MDILPYGRHVIEDDDVAAVERVLRGDWLTTGPAVTEFETELGKVAGASHAVVCANGTAALHLAALALELGPGDAVVVPAVTFTATANAARFVGADVVFADVDPHTGLLGPQHLDEALRRAGSAARAVFPVHLAGQCCDMDALAQVARPAGLRIVEDACHALGSRDGAGAPVGACRLSDMAIFSFHPVKTVAMGEGGAVCTADAALDERVRLLRGHGLTRDPSAFTVPELAFAADGQPNPWHYEMVELGFNYRASDLNCALGLSQLRKLDRFAVARRALAAAYDRLLAPLAPVVLPPQRMPGDPCWHLYAPRIDFAAAGVERAEVMARLRARGIGSQVHYIPVHRQPYYRRLGGELSLPGADAYFARTLSLPLFPGMAADDPERVVAALAGALGLA